MSTGGASLDEIDKAVSIIEDCRLALMHCESYPTPNSETYLSTIPFYAQRYNVPVGFSSHESGINHSIASCALGAPLIERHVTLSTSMEGLDHSISLSFPDFALLRSSLNALRVCLTSRLQRLSPNLPLAMVTMLACTQYVQSPQAKD